MGQCKLMIREAAGLLSIKATALKTMASISQERATSCGCGGKIGRRMWQYGVAPFLL